MGFTEGTAGADALWLAPGRTDAADPGEGEWDPVAWAPAPTWRSLRHEVSATTMRTSSTTVIPVVVVADDGEAGATT